MRDENENKVPRGDGSYLLGTTPDGKPVTLSADEICHHLLISGRLAGEAEAVAISLIESSIANGGGGIYVNGYGDVSTFAQVYAAATKYGRSDDVLVLNFMVENRSDSEARPTSHSLDPFAIGDEASWTKTIVEATFGRQPSDSDRMWEARATHLVSAALRLLTWRREVYGDTLSFGSFRDHLNLRLLVEVAYESRYPGIPEDIVKSLRVYLESLPGFQESKRASQSQTTLDQHGFLDMQLTKVVGNLADVYDYAFSSHPGEIDMVDLIGNGRILVVMLPMLEKAGGDAEVLSRVVSHLIREGLKASLGNRIAAGWDVAANARRTASKNPFLVVLDEVGYHMLEDFESLAAQARSLGFGMIVSTSGKDEIRRDAETGFVGSFRPVHQTSTERGEFVLGSLHDAGNVLFHRSRPLRCDRIKLREHDDLTWDEHLSKAFHTKTERKSEFLRKLDEGGEAGLSTEPLVLGNKLTGLPVTTSPRTMIQQSFALIGGYPKIAALRDQERDPLTDLFHLGDDRP